MSSGGWAPRAHPPLERYLSASAASSDSVTAARKYLLRPRSPTVLMLNASWSSFASPSLTPASAEIGALTIVSRLASSNALSSNLVSATETMMRTPLCWAVSSSWAGRTGAPHHPSGGGTDDRSGGQRRPYRRTADRRGAPPRGRERVDQPQATGAEKERAGAPARRRRAPVAYPQIEVSVAQRDDQAQRRIGVAQRVAGQLGDHQLGLAAVAGHAPVPAGRRDQPAGQVQAVRRELEIRPDHRVARRERGQRRRPVREGRDEPVGGQAVGERAARPVEPQRYPRPRRDPGGGREHRQRQVGVDHEFGHVDEDRRRVLGQAAEHRGPDGREAL